MSVEWFAMCIGFVTGVLSMIGAIYIAERENSKKRPTKRTRTRLYPYDLNKKKHPTDCNQKRRG